MFLNNTVTFQEILNKRRLLQTCLQFTTLSILYNLQSLFFKTIDQNFTFCEQVLTTKYFWIKVRQEFENYCHWVMRQAEKKKKKNSESSQNVENSQDNSKCRETHTS